MKFDKIKKNRRRGSNRRWTLLFIGDHGNTITIKHFKAIILAVVGVFLLISVLLAVLFFSHQQTLNANSDLQKRYQNSQQQIETLRHENEILMARLVVAESKVNEQVAEVQQPNENPAAAKPVDPKTEQAHRPKAASPPPPKKPATQVQRSQPEAQQAQETPAVMKVAVANFKVSRESGTQNVKAQFRVKNASTGYPRVAGHAVVILKGTDLEQSQWLVMPPVELDGSKPTGKRGKAFSIQRFRTMNFSSRAPKHADQFRTAKVYVYSKEGKLLLEQDFAVKLPPLPSISPEKPAENTAIREAQPAAKHSPQSPAPQKPAGASTPAEEELDSLENAPPVF
jgi:outer membrane biosynthesis protein TonB